MKVRQFVRYFLPLITLATLATSAPASCPSFDQGPPCVEYWRSAAVFIGVANRVVNVPNNSDTGPMFGPYLQSTVHFTIEEAFKGVGGTAIVLNLDNCGHRFKEGERYLVYASRNPNNNELDVRLGQTRTRPLANANADLQYIRGLSSAEPGGRVFGKVALHTQNVKNSDLEVEPLQDVKVTLEGNNQNQEAVTDNQGRYEFKRLPPGTYRFRAELPGYPVHDKTFKVTGYECVPFSIAFNRKGLILARVVDENGKPLVSVPLSLVSAEATNEEILAESSKDKGVWTFSYTDREGRASFAQLPPGRYLLVINRTEFERRRGAETARALPRLFYPGVSEVSGATVIVVSKDDELREYEFRLPIR